MFVISNDTEPHIIHSSTPTTGGGESIYWPYLSKFSTPTIGDSDLLNTPKDNSSLESMAKKLAWVTSFPRFAHSNVRATKRAGTSIDWAYDTFGSAAFHISISNKDFEDCLNYDLWGSTNAKNLMKYAAKVSRDPFSLPHGPEVRAELSRTILESINEPMSIDLRAVDTDEMVSMVLLYLDSHPYDTNSSPHATFNTSSVSIFNEATKSDENVAFLSFEIDFPEDIELGNHVFYFQAEDEVGTRGPILAQSFKIGSYTNVPTNSPTRSNEPSISHAPTGKTHKKECSSLSDKYACVNEYGHRCQWNCCNTKNQLLCLLKGECIDKVNET